MDGSAAGDLVAGRRLIFVGGAPRSGTTLVQNMLDSHPDVLGGPEFLHLEAIVRLRNQLLDSNRRNWTTDFYSGDAVDGMISDLIAKLLLPLADRHDAPYLSEKTPTNVLVARELLDLFPGSRFIHVVRDPRGIVASMLKAGERAAERGVRVQSFTRSTRDAVNYIQRCYRAGFAAADHAPGRCLEVRFEALVADPAAETARVCDFLGLPWDAKMTRPAAQDHLGETGLTEASDNIWYDRASFRRDPDATIADKWQSDLSGLQKAMILGWFADFELRDRLGYDLTPVALQGSQRLAAMGFRTARNARRRLGSARPSAA